jgi:hypothetical protein
MADTINLEALPPLRTSVLVPFKTNPLSELVKLVLAKAGLFFDPSSK